MKDTEIQVTLTIVAGDDVGMSTQIKGERTVIGRRKADIALRDKKVSNQHAVVEVSGSEVRIKDLDSRNGILLNGKPVRDALLNNLDEIQLGLTKIKVLIVADLSAFRTRNIPSDEHEAESKKAAPRNIGSMIDDELKRFSKWDLSSSAEGLPAGVRVQFGLEVISGPEAGRRIPIEKNSVTLGRAKADIVFHDGDVSRLHASIEIGSQGLVIVRDLGSTNGTWVNSKQVSEARLVPNDEIQLGGTVCRLVSFD